MIWLILCVMSLAALLFICAPLYGPYEGPKNEQTESDEISEYRAALAALEDNDERLMFERQILKAASPAKDARDNSAGKTAGVSPRWTSIGVFMFILIAAPALYGYLGAPRFETLTVQPPLTAAPDIAAMSEEDRAVMIQAMVDGLSERLYETPQDTQGWLRLLRSRKVLGQEAVARAEIARLREALAGQDAVIEEIISQSGWDVK